MHQESPPRTILTVNPGSTSTKLSLFEDDHCVSSYEVVHAPKSALRGVALDREVDSYVESIEQFLLACGGAKPDAVVGRGGFLNREQARVESGVYEVAARVNGQVIVHQDIVRGVRDLAEMDHPSNLGIPIAARLAQRFQCPAFTVDPVVSDDFEPVARYSGYASIERKSVAHVLSIRAMARKAAAQLERAFEQCSFVVVHMGGGITVAAVREGRMVDNSLALLGEGPFTPQRAGSLPQKALIDLCYSGRFTKEQLFRELTKHAGLASYLGDDDMVAIEQRIAEGDRDAELAVDAMVYQIAKEVGAMCVAAGREVHAVVISGGLAKSQRIVDRLKSHTDHLAPIIVFPENVEMEAMAKGALNVLRGEQPVKHYCLQSQ
jgi:butyrate kinase